jgi:DMSO/TMAO reductase YedYZ molybdopterin-dependent catalytic subunit
MNGEPLPIVHGFPVRLLVPGWYGVSNVKWLDRIDLSGDRLMTRFMARDYVTLMGKEVDGEIEWVETSVTRQRVKSVIARVTRLGERFTAFGAAWSDGTPLARVEVSVDGGGWQAATLDPAQGPHTWTFFSFQTTGLAPGEHTLVSRATDELGRSQPENLELKQTRWENNELFVRTIAV